MNMQFPQHFRSTRFPSQLMQQEDDALYVMLKQTNKSALTAKLNSGFFSQKTLHALLYKAFLEESPFVVAMMLTTASYDSEVVLANIVIASLVNEQEKSEQVENDNERFVSELLKDKFLKLKVLNKALDIAAEKELKSNDNLPLTKKLIELAMLSAREKEQIALTSSYVSEPHVFKEQEAQGRDVPRFESKSLSIPSRLGCIHINASHHNQMVIDQGKMTEKVSPTKTIATPPKLIQQRTEPACFSNLVPEVKLNIGDFLTVKDLLRCSQTNRHHYNVMQEVLRKRTRYITVDQLTEAALRILAKVTCLNLHFANYHLRNNESLMANIGRLPNIHALTLFHTTATMFGFDHLEKLIHLHSLSLNHSAVSASSLTVIGKLPRLRNLILSNTKVTDDGLSELEKLTNLQSLNLSSTKVTDDGLSELEKLTNLQSLELGFTKVSDVGLQHLAKLTNLENLGLSRAHITDAELHRLEKLIHLQILCLNGTKVSELGLRSLLEKLVNLQMLNLSRTYVSDLGLLPLEKLRHLRSLDLSGTAITDADLRNLEKCPDLQTLDLSETAITDAGLPYLQKLTHLQVLNLSRTAVTRAGQRDLNKLTKLHTLVLHGTEIDMESFAPTIFRVVMPGNPLSFSEGFIF